MAGNTLDTVGNGAMLLIGDTGTLTNDGSTKVGTLSGGGLASGALTGSTLTGTLGDGILLAAYNVGTLTLYDITPNTIKSPSVETTKLDARAETSQPGIPDYGEYEAVIPYTAANTKLFNSAQVGRQLLFFKNTVDDFTTDSAQTFCGWIMESNPIGDKQEKNKAAQSKVKIKITGVGVFAGGS